MVLHDSASVVERLIPVTIPADSAWLYALMECDSLNNIVIKQLSESKTKNTQTSYTLTQTGKQALLNYTAQTRPDTVYLKEKTISTYKEKTSKRADSCQDAAEMVAKDTDMGRSVFERTNNYCNHQKNILK